MMGRGAAGAWVGLLLGVLAAAWPGVGQAKWLKAETERFAVYSDGREADLRKFTARLIAFDAMLRRLHGELPATVPRRKFEVYLVQEWRTLSRAAPGVGGGVMGFYRAGLDGVHALAVEGGGRLGEDEVLFHEYTHHFMLENYPAAYPAWLVEGYAEYFGPARVTPEQIEIGRFSDLRGNSVLREQWIGLPTLLNKRLNKATAHRVNVFYAQSWLITHYMLSDTTRARQLEQAVQAMGRGERPLDAMLKATGMTADQLTHALRQYMRGKLSVRTMPNPVGGEPPMRISELPASAEDLLMERLALGAGFTDDPKHAEKVKELKMELLEKVRARAPRHPGDRLAELALARAEIDLGDPSAGEAILARRLAANPNEAEALRLMARSRMNAGKKDEARRAELHQEARTLLARANAAEPNDYRTLYEYARARSVEPGYPDTNTLEVLLLAHELAPSVAEVRFEAGRGLVRSGHYDQAEEVLSALANQPHEHPLREKAAELIAQARKAAGKAADIEESETAQ